MNTALQVRTKQGPQLKRMIEAYPAASVPCTLEHQAAHTQGFIISINGRYARIFCTTLEDLDSIPLDSSLTLKTTLKAGSCCLHNVECSVAWKHRSEMGLGFKVGAKVGIAELQEEFNGIHRS